MADTSKYIERAENEIKRRNYDMAMDLFMEILQIDPDCGQARSGIRRAALKKLERKYPSPLTAGILNLPTNLLLGIAGLFKARNWAANLCESALRRDPRNAKVNQRLGNVLMSLGHENSALEVFRVVTEFDEKNIEALKTLGRLLYERKEIEEAIGCYERALKINPRDQEANKMRKNLAAEGAIQKGGFEKAGSARELAKSQGQLKETERAQRIVRTAEDLAEAIEEAEQQLEEAPDDVGRIMGLAKLRVQNRDLDEAVDLYLRVLKIDPEHTEAQEQLGDVRIRRLEARIADARKELESGEEGAESRIKRLRTELTELQIEEFQRRIEAHPTDLGLRFRLGQALLADNRVDEAIEQFQNAVKDPKHRVPALHLLGRSFAMKGITDLAIKQLEQAAESIRGMNAQRKEILYELAQVCERAEEQPKALATYKQIYEADISYRDVGTRIEALS